MEELLLENSHRGRLPMHMPGHKRNTEAFPYLGPLGGALDITEIDGFDDLNDPHGIFASSERRAAALWGSAAAVYSVNGSTGAILASVRAALAETDDHPHVLLARNAHRSVYHAIELCRAVPVYTAVHISPDGIPLSVSPREIESALCADPSIALVIITSPTYEGVISDIREISRVCTAHGVILLVDEAHGAHLGLCGALPDGSVACGADIAVQSLHKTLPSLTQTAIVHIGARFAPHTDEVRRQMQIFQTSSPSYLLSASIDGAVRYLERDGGHRLEDLAKSLADMRHRLGKMQQLRLLAKSDGIFAVDPMHITVTTGSAGISGVELCRKLREHGIEPEMASSGHAVMLSGAGDSPTSLTHLTDALLGIDRELAEARSFAPRHNGSRNTAAFSETPSHAADALLHIPRRRMPPSDAAFVPSCTVPPERAAGLTSAAYISAYPPGIPIIVPGEVIDRDVTDAIARLADAGCALRGLTEDGMLRVMCEQNQEDRR